MGLIPYKNEEYLDWSDEKNVLAMQAALRDVGGRLDRSYPLVIGGKSWSDTHHKLGCNGRLLEAAILACL